jgi:hypothetical protein
MGAVRLLLMGRYGHEARRRGLGNEAGVGVGRGEYTIRPYKLSSTEADEERHGAGRPHHRQARGSRRRPVLRPSPSR